MTDDGDPDAMPARSSQSDVEMLEPVFWVDSVDEELARTVKKAAAMRSAPPPPLTQTTRSSRILLASPSARRPRRSLADPYPTTMQSATPYGDSGSTSGVKRPRRTRSLPKPHHLDMSGTVQSKVAGPTRSISAPSALAIAPAEDSSDLVAGEDDRLDRLIVQVQARLGMQASMGNKPLKPVQRMSTAAAKRVKEPPAGPEGAHHDGRSTSEAVCQPGRSSALTKVTPAMTSSVKSPPSIATSVATPTRVLRDRTRQSPRAMNANSSKLNPLPANIKHDLHSSMQLAKGGQMGSGQSRHTATAQQKQGQMAKASHMGLRPTNTPSFTEKPRSLKIFPDIPTNTRSVPPPALPRGPTSTISLAPSQGLPPAASPSRRTHTFKTPFLKTPAAELPQQNQSKARATTALQVQGKVGHPADTGEGNDSFDSMDLEGMFGDEVEAVMKAYDG